MWMKTNPDALISSESTESATAATNWLGPDHYADAMSGETDLNAMLATLEVVRRPGTFVYVEVDTPAGIEVGDGIEALLNDGDSFTVVATIEAAERHGWDAEFPAAWLTLTVHSSLEAVGLTAAFAASLGEAEIPCNVIAGFRHDHILVPVAMAERAIGQLALLRNLDR